jgi:hypothetical protein
MTVVIKTEEGNDLNRCLDSLKNQTSQDFKTMIAEKIDNSVLQQCDEYVFFMEGNDYAEPTFIESFYKTNKDFDIVLINEMIHEGDSILKNDFIVENKSDYIIRCFETDFKRINKFYKKELLQNLQFEQGNLADAFLNIQAIILAKSFGEIKETLYHHMAQNKRLSREEAYYTLLRIKEFLNNSGFQPDNEVGNNTAEIKEVDMSKIYSYEINFILEKALRKYGQGIVKNMLPIHYQRYDDL